MASWFYLTLWNGSPDEFTSEYSIDVATMGSHEALMDMLDAIDLKPCTGSTFDATIDGNHRIGSDIDTRTEVIWNVRDDHRGQDVHT